MDTPKAPKLFLMPEDLRKDILGYLMSRPYAEVAKGVQRLEALAELGPLAAPPLPPAGGDANGNG